jgi:hypothetical protein
MQALRCGAERVNVMSNSTFDDFVLKAKDLADAATKKTGEIVEISRYKYECIKINGEIKRLYEQLGSTVYSMKKYGYENEDLVEAITEEIDDCLDRLDEINDMINGMKKTVVCPVCGSKNETYSSFCSKCGTKLGAENCCDGCCGCGDASEDDDCDCGACGTENPASEDTAE